MGKLNENLKHAIVLKLACFGRHSDIAKAVSADWGTEVSRWQVRSYDPSSMAYAAGQKWRDIFEAERARYLNEVGDIPIVHAGYRLQMMQRLFEGSLKRRDYTTALAVLRDAAKEAGPNFQRALNARNPNVGTGYFDLPEDERRAMIAKWFSDSSQKEPTDPDSGKNPTETNTQRDVKDAA